MECDIENLVEELCTRLKSLQAEQSAGNSLVPSHRDLHSCDSDSEYLDSPDNEAERYYEAFPALSEKTKLVPPEPVSLGSWATRCKGDSPGDKSPEGKPSRGGNKHRHESHNNNNNRHQTRKSKSASISRNSTTPTRHQRKFSLPDNTVRIDKSPVPCQPKYPLTKTAEESTVPKQDDRIKEKECASANNSSVGKENPSVTASSDAAEIGKCLGKNGTFDGLFVQATKEDLKWYTDPMGDIFTPTTKKSKLQTLYKLSDPSITARVEEDLNDTAQALVESLCQEAISEAMKSEHIAMQPQDVKEDVSSLVEDAESEKVTSPPGEELQVVVSDVDKAISDSVNAPKIDSIQWKIPDLGKEENTETLAANLEGLHSPGNTEEAKAQKVEEIAMERSEAETSPTVEDLFGAFRVNLAAIWDDRSPDIAGNEPTWTSPVTTESEQNQKNETLLSYRCLNDSVEQFSDEKAPVGNLKSPIEMLQYQDAATSRDTSVIASPDGDLQISDARSTGIDSMWPQTTSLYDSPEVNILESEEILNESDFQRTLNIDAPWHCINASASPFNHATNTPRENTDSSVWDVNNALWSTYDLETSLIQPPKFVNNNNMYRPDAEADRLQQQTGFIPGGVYGNISVKASAQLNVEDNHGSQSASPISKEIWESGSMDQHFPTSNRNSSRFVFAQEQTQPELEEVQSFDFGQRTTSRYHFARGRTPGETDCLENNSRAMEDGGMVEDALGDVCVPYDAETVDLSALEDIRDIDALGFHDIFEMEQCNRLHTECKDSFPIDSDKDLLSYPHQSATFTYHKGAFTKIIPKSRTEPIIPGSSWSGPIGRGRAFGPFQYGDTQETLSKQMLAWENLLISPKTHFKPIKESFSSESPFECDEHSSAQSSIKNGETSNIDVGHQGITDIYGGYGGRFAHSAPDGASFRPDPKLKYFLSQYTQRWSTGSDDAEIENYTSHMPRPELHKQANVGPEATAVLDTGKINVLDSKAGETKGNLLVKQASVGGLYGNDQDMSLPEDIESHSYNVPESTEYPTMPLEFEDQMFPFEGDITTMEGSFDANQMVFSFDLEREWMKATHPDIYKKKKPRKGYSKKPCSFYLEGSCHRADCKFAHDLSNITCRFWEEGSCFKGMDCPFLHGYSSEQVTPCDSQDGSKPNSFTLDTENFPELPKSSTDKSSSSTESTPPGTLRRRGKGMLNKNNTKPNKKPSLYSSKPGGSHKKSLPININYKK
ncbi:uncharacterized protein KIAA0232-like isoform X2 [Ptychodera flava]|uniref:uncharacterized protein KIAA0232-like isoform X2 n=1 Tax=Ptychodera flava TaxID=63121 RepID=UPI00396A5087